MSRWDMHRARLEGRARPKDGGGGEIVGDVVLEVAVGFTWR
jgi:hypothetical protein